MLGPNRCRAIDPDLGESGLQVTFEETGHEANWLAALGREVCNRTPELLLVR
jgi:hypothetical protein